jgi:RNA polymerase sigma-70 factor, ECF subfamily
VGVEGGEQSIREAHAAGDFARVATETLQQYGPEVLGLLFALHRDRDEASDAFSVFSERLWQSLAEFEWRCSMRTWAYMLARRVSRDVRRGEGRRGRRNVGLSDANVSRVAAQVRTRTLTILRTETKTAIMKLRESLPEDDQLLLVLRVDRDLAWNDLALVFLDAKNEESDQETLKREAARLRKRFQLVKERLLEMGRERGLVGR